MTETFMAWYSASTFEEFMIKNRMTGPYAPLYWSLILCNILIPQILWWKKARGSVPLLFAVSIVVNIGMWLERFVIIFNSLHNEFLPSFWSMYRPTIWVFSMFLASIGLFLSLLFLFSRFLPMISIFEIRTILPQAEPH